MVKAIRNVEIAISGSGIKEPSISESKNKAVVRKSIVASKNIQAGDVLNEINLAVKRPGTGISPMQWTEVIGTQAIRDFAKDEIIEL
jgi:sialic acid synthase SpsE